MGDKKGNIFDPDLPVNPAEHPGIGGMSYTVGNPISPVLGESMLLGDGSEPAVDHGHLHDYILLVGADVVPPQGGERFIHATISCKYSGIE